MDTSERTRLRALYEAATQTPWRQDGCEITVMGSTLGVDGGETVIAESTLPACAEVADEEREEQEERNAALVVGAVNALPDALDTLDTVERERDEAVARATRAETERDALRAIIEGRTVAPTDAEITAHAAAGGEWLVRYRTPYDHGVYCEAFQGADPFRGEGALLAERWWAMLDGRPCAWPTVTP